MSIALWTGSLCYLFVIDYYRCCDVASVPVASDLQSQPKYGKYSETHSKIGFETMFGTITDVSGRRLRVRYGRDRTNNSSPGMPDKEETGIDVLCWFIIGEIYTRRAENRLSHPSIM